MISRSTLAYNLKFLPKTLPRQSLRWQTRVPNRTFGRSLTIDQLLTQGGHRNLRGYPTFYQLGNERYQIHLEHRYYHDWNLLQLIQFASAVYVDVGRAWFTEPALGLSRYDDDQMLWNLGMGLRIASNRAGSSSILHLDLAFPMTPSPELASNQLGEPPDELRVTLELKSRF